MTQKIRFTKMHGAGNDYIYVDTTRNPLQNPGELSVAWSRPHTGIGSDGLVLIGRSDVADFSMRIFNADGRHPGHSLRHQDPRPPSGPRRTHRHGDRRHGRSLRPADGRLG